MSDPQSRSESKPLLTWADVRPEHDAILFELYAAVRVEELHLESWDVPARNQMLRSQFDAQRRGYREQYPAAGERLILREGVPIGWVIVDRSGRDLHGIDIALRSDERSRGVGTGIIRALQHEAATEGRGMMITVQRFNLPARALYERLGFRATTETDLHIVMQWTPE